VRALFLMILVAAPGCRGCVGPPDVLLIVVDTLRADALGVYGEAQPVTPNLDALAGSGVRFERAIAASGYTVPSHASLFTGRYPRRHSIGYGNGRTRLGTEPTWAERMHAAGYDTAAFVSNMTLKKRVGLNRGFTHYDDQLPSWEAVRKWARERVARDTTAAASRWLREERAQPFFLWVHYQDPHGPYTPPAGRRFQGSRDGSTEPLPLLKDHFGEGGVPNYQRLKDAKTVDDYHGRYLAEAAYADREIGKLLRAAGEASDRKLLVIFTSDHGESFGEESFYFVHGHTAMPDLARVPLIINGPGLDSQVWTDPISHVDLLPTVLGLLELPTMAGVDGRDVSEGLRAEREPPPAAVYCDVGYELVVYRGDQMLRVRSAERNVTVDAFYKSGRADRAGDLLQLDSVASTQIYRWGSDFVLTPETEVWGVSSYFSGNTRPGAEVVWSDEELEALRELGYVDQP